MSALAHRLSPLHRLTAWLGIALVLALNILAVRPDLHEALHATDQATSGHSHTCSHGHQHTAPVTSDDHDCVISTFAHGHADCAVAPLAVPTVAFTQVAAISAASFFIPGETEFLLPPGCGPPLV
jgi:hypothetical protein